MISFRQKGDFSKLTRFLERAKEAVHIGDLDTEDAKPQAKTVTPSTESQTILPDSDDGYNYLSQVTVEAIPYNESENPAGGTTVTIG